MKIEWINWETFRGTFTNRHAFVNGAPESLCGLPLPVKEQQQCSPLNPHYCRRCENVISKNREMNNA